MIPKPPKKKVCRECSEYFIPTRAIQPVCESFECKVAYANKAAIKFKLARERKSRSDTRIAKEKIKTRQEHLKDAQRWFNTYIRKRDSDEPCISCGRHHEGQWHAGHYKSVGSSPELRFDEYNCHKQCSACNNYLSGNIVNYRLHLSRKIGITQLDRLEGECIAKHYSIEEIQAIKSKYKTLCHELENQHEIC